MADSGENYLCSLVRSCFYFQANAVSITPVRWLNLQEFQSKKLMADNGLHVQRFKVAESGKEAVAIAKELSKLVVEKIIL